MSKYHNKICYADGYKFDSLKERDYYFYLKQKLEGGEISDLQMQVRFEVIPGVYEEYDEVKHLKTKDKIVHKRRTIQQPTYYLADFVYIDTKTGLKEVVDVKSEATKKKEAYRLKKKMMLAYKGITVIEV